MKKIILVLTMCTVTGLVFADDSLEMELQGEGYTPLSSILADDIEMIGPTFMPDMTTGAEDAGDPLIEFLQDVDEE